MAKAAIVEHTRTRTDPAAMPAHPAGGAAADFEFMHAKAKHEKKYSDVASAPEAESVPGAVKVAKCPACGYHMLYVLQGQKAFVLNQSTSGLAKLLPAEQTLFDENKGAVCGACNAVLRLP